MQLKNKLFLAFLFLTVTCALTEAQENGYLSVSAGDSTQIYVDTLLVGENAITYLQISAGTHTVHVYNPYSRNWSDRGLSKEIEVKPGELVQLDLRMKETVKIVSIPFSSKVFLGKELLGQTPLIFDRASLTDQTLRIENKGFKEKSFNLVQGQNVYKVSLDPLNSSGKK